MTHSNKLDELISAYLDSEISPHDRRNVEQLIEHDPHLQKKIYDLEELTYNVIELFGGLEPTSNTQRQLELIHSFHRQIL